MKRALVLSGGGLFGAWQVGAWSVLREHVPFDVVIGVSIGALNGWAIAGGATPDQLASKWLNVAAKGRLKLRLPLRPFDGIVEFSQIEGFIRDIYDSYQPQMEFYAILTELFRLRPTLVEGKNMEWRHLAGSCAMFGLLPQQRIGNVLYTDGGLLGAMPMWAAAQLQATHAIGLNVMPKMPWPVRAAVTCLRMIRTRPDRLRENHVMLSPSQSLGHWKGGALYHHAWVEEWMRQGREDAAAAIRSGSLAFLT
ncbi:MAG TPA: patatin-like phospholipase family protein [Bryobacteraceae bacterium]|nr:patatin-like phospholipase family protein [Bryobacteraceae bacterium]